MKGKAKVVKKVKAVKKEKVVRKAKSGERVGKKRSLTDAQHKQLVKMHASRKHSGKELCEKFGISPPTLYNYINRDVD